jgi:hypothetical protein
MCDHRNYRNKINPPPLRWCNLQLKMLNRYLKKKGRIEGGIGRTGYRGRSITGPSNSNPSNDPNKSPS